MAKGSISLWSPESWAGRIDWRSAVIPGKNASSVNADCCVWRTDGGESYGNNPYWGRVWIGKISESFDFARIDGSEQYVGSCWAEVPHDGEGRASVHISADIYGSDHNDLEGSTLEGGETVALDEIPQAGPSRISFSQESVQMGKNLLISIERDHKDCYHTLTYTFGGASGTLGTEIGTSFAWTVPDLASHCGLRGTCRITCRTYLGKRDLGTTAGQVTLLLPDPSKAELKEAVLGTPGEIACRRGSGNFSLDVSLLLGGGEYPVGKGKEDRFFWTPSYDLALAMTDQVIMNGLLRCRTYNGNSLTGTVDSPIRLTVPENEVTRPRITSLILRPEAPESLLKYGYLLGKSGLRAEMEGESSCSGIARYSLKAGRASASGNPSVIPMLEDQGTVTVTATVTDLRGFQTSVVREIQVIPYEKPRIVPFTGAEKVICQRAEPSGALSSTGPCLAIRAGIRFTGIAPEGTEQNRCSLSFRLGIGEAPFGPWQSLISDGRREISVLKKKLLPDLKKSCRAELLAEDALGEKTVLSFSILSQAVSFALYDGIDGAAFGKYPEAPHVVDLAEHMTLLVRGSLELRGEKWQDLGLAPGILPPSEQRGTAQGACLRLSGGNQVFLAFSCRMPQENLSVNNTPVPQKLCPQTLVSAVCPSEGGAVLASVGTDGLIRVSPLLGNQDPSWIEGGLHYFL